MAITLGSHFMCSDLYAQSSHSCNHSSASRYSSLYMESRAWWQACVTAITYWHYTSKSMGALSLGTRVGWLRSKSASSTVIESPREAAFRIPNPTQGMLDRHHVTYEDIRCIFGMIIDLVHHPPLMEQKIPSHWKCISQSRTSRSDVHVPRLPINMQSDTVSQKTCSGSLDLLLSPNNQRSSKSPNSKATRRSRTVKTSVNIDQFPNMSSSSKPSKQFSVQANHEYRPSDQLLSSDINELSFCFIIHFFCLSSHISCMMAMYWSAY